MAPIFPTRTITLRTLLIYAFVFCAFAGFVLYVLFQARLLIIGPEITISTHPLSSDERVVILEGTAKNIVQMTLNGRHIYTDTAGNFKEALVLENGYTIATLQAEDRYGRVQNIERAFVYQSDERTITN